MPYAININNATDVSEMCDTPSYEWLINYFPSYCGTTSGANFVNSTNVNSENPEIEFISRELMNSF